MKMGAGRNAIRLFVLSLALACSGCLEIRTTTAVNSDGSFVREISFTGDSSEVAREYPLFITDSTWTRVVKRVKDTAWVSTFTKVFPGTESLAAAMKGEPGRSLAVRIGFETRFRWFTTEYAYAETLLCYNQINAVPLSKYLSKEQVDFWLSHEKRDAKEGFRTKEDSLAYERIEEIGPEWDARNKFEQFQGILLTGVRRMNNAGLTESAVLAAKESLYTACARKLQSSSAMLDTLENGVTSVLRNKLVHEAFLASAPELREFERKLQFQEQLMGAPYNEASIVMPGIITGTNAESIEGNRLEWKGFMPKAYVGDVTMWAQSRVINWWAIIVTGLAVVALVVGVLIGAMGKRGGSGA
jgi:hypothetical protein